MSSWSKQVLLTFSHRLCLLHFLTFCLLHLCLAFLRHSQGSPCLSQSLTSSAVLFSNFESISLYFFVFKAVNGKIINLKRVQKKAVPHDRLYQLHNKTSLQGFEVCFCSVYIYRAFICILGFLKDVKNCTKDPLNVSIAFLLPLLACSIEKLDWIWHELLLRSPC